MSVYTVVMGVCFVSFPSVMDFLFLSLSPSLSPSPSVSLQPEEYGQEAMEGQGESMLEPEGETYDETQQVIVLHASVCSVFMDCMSRRSAGIRLC